VTKRVWVFDVDGTIVDSLTGSFLRPGTVPLLNHLRERFAVLLWSAGGAQYAWERAAQHGVANLFDGFHSKDERDDDSRYLPSFLDAPLDATYVDDRPEDIPIGAAVVAVSPYLAGSPFDRAFERVLAREPAGSPAPEGTGMASQSMTGSSSDNSL
jgi:hypothetical protein